MGSVKLDHVDLDELSDIHERLAFTFRMSGLRGMELDQAIVAALHPALEQIEASRQAEVDRRERSAPEIA
jgi:hypothetical protein